MQFENQVESIKHQEGKGFFLGIWEGNMRGEKLRKDISLLCLQSMKSYEKQDQPIIFNLLKILSRCIIYQ